MTDENRVVSMSGKPVSGDVVVDEKLVETLEELLVDARAGKLRSFAMATIYVGDSSMSSYSLGMGDSMTTLIGSVNRLMHHLNMDMDDK